MEAGSTTIRRLGSTPTLWRSHEIPGRTEIRAGSCIYNDRESAGLGAAGAEDLAHRGVAGEVAQRLEQPVPIRHHQRKAAAGLARFSMILVRVAGIAPGSTSLTSNSAAPS